jgi:hypothetical protein
MINFKLGAVAAALGFVLSLVLGLVTGAGVFALIRAVIFAAFFFVLACSLYIAASRFLPELLEISAGPDGRDDEPGSRVNIAVDGDIASGGFGMAASPDSGAGVEGLEIAFDPDAPIPNAALDQLGEDGYTKEGMDGPTFGAASAPALEMGGGFAPSGGGARNVFESGGAASAFERSEMPPGAAALPVAGSAALPEGEDNPDSVDVLPDLEAMSQAFLASTQEAEQGGEDNGGSNGDGNPFESGGFQDTPEEVFEVSVSGQSRVPAPYTGNKPAVLEGDFQSKDIAQAIQTLLKRE